MRSIKDLFSEAPIAGVLGALPDELKEALNGKSMADLGNASDADLANLLELAKEHLHYVNLYSSVMALLGDSLDLAKTDPFVRRLLKDDDDFWADAPDPSTPDARDHYMVMGIAIGRVLMLLALDDHGALKDEAQSNARPAQS